MEKQRAIEQYLRLVNRQSISETEGEITFGDFLYQEIQNIGYFNEHPGDVLKVPVKRSKGIGSNANPPPMRRSSSLAITTRSGSRITAGWRTWRLIPSNLHEDSKKIQVA